jgi:hypothetical protein
MYLLTPAEIKLIRLIREEKEKRPDKRPLLFLDISTENIMVTTAVKTNVLSNVDATVNFD